MTLTTSDNGIMLIKHYEGLGPHFDGVRAFPYVCPAGKPTIGFGHVIRPGEHFEHGLTMGEVEVLLRRDLRRFEQAANLYVKVPIRQGFFDALVSFAYNLGTEALRTSTLLQLLNKGNYPAAYDQFLLWCEAKVGGRMKRLNGLYYRRLTERHLAITGELRFVANNADARETLKLHPVFTRVQ
jgi:lysozyme